MKKITKKELIKVITESIMQSHEEKEVYALVSLGYGEVIVVSGNTVEAVKKEASFYDGTITVIFHADIIAGSFFD